MGTKEKLIERFKTIPSDFTFDELERLLAIYGFERFKGLRKENLRDNMTNEELVMNMLAGLTTTNITKEEHPVTMDEHAQAASRGGAVARVAREAFEQQTGKKVSSEQHEEQLIELFKD